MELNGCVKSLLGRIMIEEDSKYLRKRQSKPLMETIRIVIKAPSTWLTVRYVDYSFISKTSRE